MGKKEEARPHRSHGMLNLSESDSSDEEYPLPRMEMKETSSNDSSSSSSSSSSSDSDSSDSSESSDSSDNENPSLLKNGNCKTLN